MKIGPMLALMVLFLAACDDPAPVHRMASPPNPAIAALEAAGYKNVLPSKTDILCCGVWTGNDCLKAYKVSFEAEKDGARVTGLWCDLALTAATPPEATKGKEPA